MHGPCNETLQRYKLKTFLILLPSSGSQVRALSVVNHCSSVGRAAAYFTFRLYFLMPMWDSGRLRLTCNQDQKWHRRFKSGHRLKLGYSTTVSISDSDSEDCSSNLCIPTKLQCSYNGYYMTLPRSRWQFDSATLLQCVQTLKFY